MLGCERPKLSRTPESAAAAIQLLLLDVLQHRSRHAMREQRALARLSAPQQGLADARGRDVGQRQGIDVGVRIARPSQHVRRSERADAVEGVPLGGVAQDVRAHEQAQRPVRVGRGQGLQGAQGQAWRGELTLDRRDEHPFDALERELTQPQAMLKRRELLVKSVLEHRHDQHLIEASDLERVHGGKDVRDVRRVEAAAVNCDRFPHPVRPVYSVSVSDASRIRALSDPVSITHDAEPVLVERGEMLAGGLVAAGRWLLARSPKLHRARGPYCLRGACDGCTARVNGVPNVMTCLVKAAEGDRIETQNVLGSREVDLYEATDLLFPQGFDHHRLLAGTGTSRLLTHFARRVSGLGQLPDAVSDRVAAEQLTVDVLIVGGGAAGLAAAAVLGTRALLVDDALALGGSLAALEPARAARLIQRARDAGAQLRHATSAVLLSREPEDGSARISAVLEGPERASAVRCRTVLVASGAHDPTPLFGNNDLPGVVSARAALKLLRSGISIGKRVALVGEGRFARAFAEGRNQQGVFRFEPSNVQRAKGQHAVSRLVYEEAGKSREIVVSALAFDGPGAPAVELLAQLGAILRFDAVRGYAPNLAADGLAASQVFAAGSCAATKLASEEDGARVARLIPT